MAIIDEDVLLEVKAGLLIASAVGMLIHLKDYEPANHTRRWRELDKAEDSLINLFKYYKLIDRFDISKLGITFFNEEHETRLAELIEMGLEELPPAEPGGRPQLMFRDRWQPGQKLTDGKKRIYVIGFENGQYHFSYEGELGTYYSKAVFPKDPYLLRWEKVK